jgi:monothiol glutaredoxin
MALDDALRQKLTDLVTKNPVVLFMKGTRSTPQCGFSASVVAILDDVLPTYVTIDVLADPALRDGVKDFSEWPTIPQLYVRGQFVGGADIVRELEASGELAKLLDGLTRAADAPPALALTDRAAEALREACAEPGDDQLRFEIDARFENSLYFGPPTDRDVVVEVSGVVIRMDPATARRANGVSIDFVADRGGFRIDNPNEPAKVKPMTAQELKALMDAGAPLELFDVRTDKERAIATIPGARHLTQAGVEDLMKLPRDTRVVFHCHHGIRSQSAAEQALAQGFTSVFNLKGGIDAWSTTVDPSVARY